MGFVKKCNAYLLYIRYFLSKILDIKRCLRGLVNCLRSDFVNTSFSFHGLRLDCHWPNGDAALWALPQFSVCRCVYYKRYRLSPSFLVFFFSIRWSLTGLCQTLKSIWKMESLRRRVMISCSKRLFSQRLTQFRGTCSEWTSSGWSLGGGQRMIWKDPRSSCRLAFGFAHWRHSFVPTTTVENYKMPSKIPAVTLLPAKEPPVRCD